MCLLCRLHHITWKVLEGWLVIWNASKNHALKYFRRNKHWTWGLWWNLENLVRNHVYSNLIILRNLRYWSEFLVLTKKLCSRASIRFIGLQMVFYFISTRSKSTQLNSNLTPQEGALILDAFVVPWPLHASKHKVIWWTEQKLDRYVRVKSQNEPTFLE